MLQVLPLEVLEKVLGYLNCHDLLIFCLAFKLPYECLSEYFWKTLCLREDFLKIYNGEDWHECFENGMNKRMGHFKKSKNILCGTVKHVYMRLIITLDTESYHIYILEKNNKYDMIQTIDITDSEIEFKNEFMIVRDVSYTALHRCNYSSKLYEFYTLIPERHYNIFGISEQYCTAYDSKKKCFNIYKLSDGEKSEENLPDDVKFLICKLLYNESIAISVISLYQGYKIKVFDINSKTWILDLVCFESSGITNDPILWIGSHFIGCCDISYRLRGNYFGPLKVWNKEGNLVLKTNVSPSTKHYLRCFFKEKNIIITTSDNSIDVFNDFGGNGTSMKFKSEFKDIKLSSGHLIFILLEYNDSIIHVYNWNLCIHLYDIQLTNSPVQWLASEYCHCFIDQRRNYELVQYF